MIINDSDAIARLLSPNNLMNRLSKLSDSSKERKNAMSLFIRPDAKLPQTRIAPPVATNEVLTVTDSSGVSLDDLSKDHDNKIQLALAHDSAITLLNNSIASLTAKLDDVRADKLPAVIAAASRTVESIRKERLEASRKGNNEEVHYHFYTPQQKQLADYEVIEVGQPA